MTQELEHETKNLRKKLEDSQKEALSNQSAANILTQFINEGHAELDGQGQVRLVPNLI